MLATLASAGATALLPCFTIVGILFAPFVFVIAIIHAMVIGLPLALIFNHMRWINPFTTIIGGFVIGALPIGLTMGRDIISAAGWHSVKDTLLLFGFFGAIGGAAFWLTLHRMAKKNADVDVHAFE
jgi:hypothetical protein